MDIDRILSELDTEIARLQQIRATLGGVNSGAAAGTKKRGRPKGTKNAGSAHAKKIRTLSPEARKRIADAQRKRWAAKKKTE